MKPIQLLFLRSDNTNMNRSVSPADHRSYLKCIISTFLLLAAAWGLSDIAFAVFGKPSPITIGEMEYVDGMGYAMRRGQQSYAGSINLDGFRGDPLPPRRPQETRILVIGDSVSFGTGLEQGQDWPAQLEKFLRAQGVDATVMNGGTPGYTVLQMFSMLKYYDRRLKFDLVIVNGTGNMVVFAAPADLENVRQTPEFFFPERRSLLPRDECRLELAAALPAQPGNGAVPTVLKFLSLHSRTAEYLITLWPQPPKPTQSTATECVTGEWAKQWLALGEMITYVNERKMPVIVMKPFFAFNHSEVRGSQNLQWKFLPDALKKEAARLMQMVGAIDLFFRFFEERSASSGSGLVSFFDPIAAFEWNAHANHTEIKNLYLDDYVHLSVPGSKAYAELIGRDLLKRKVVAPSSAAGWPRPLPSQAKMSDLKWEKLDKTTLLPTLVGALMSCLILIFFVIPAGLVVQSAFNGSRFPHLTVPLLGFFAIYAVSMFCKNFGVNEFAVLCAMLVAVWCALLIQTWRCGLYRLHRDMKGLTLVFVHVAITSGMFFLFAICLSVPTLKGGYSGKLQLFAAWSGYEKLDEERRPTIIELNSRARQDGVDRPGQLVQALAPQKKLLMPVAPSLSEFLLRLTGSAGSATSALISEALMVSAAIAMWAFAVVKRVGGGNLPALLAGAAVMVLAVLWSPTPITCQALAAICCVLLASFIERQWVKVAMYIAGGGIIFILPGPHFLVALVAVAGAAGWIQFRRRNAGSHGAVASSAATAAVTLVTLLAGRAFVFNLTVADLRMYTALDAMKIPRFFY